MKTRVIDNGWRASESPLTPRCPQCGTCLDYRAPQWHSADTEGEYTCSACRVSYRRFQGRWFQRAALVLVRKGEAA